jgi:hypothetical protein
MPFVRGSIIQVQEASMEIPPSQQPVRTEVLYANDRLNPIFR